MREEIAGEEPDAPSSKKRNRRPKVSVVLLK